MNSPEHSSAEKLDTPDSIEDGAEVIDLNAKYRKFCEHQDSDALKGQELKLKAILGRAHSTAENEEVVIDIGDEPLPKYMAIIAIEERLEIVAEGMKKAEALDKRFG